MQIDDYETCGLCCSQVLFTTREKRAIPGMEVVLAGHDPLDLLQCLVLI
jgi:hypothetical protein